MPTVPPRSARDTMAAIIADDHELDAMMTAELTALCQGVARLSFQWRTGHVLDPAAVGQVLGHVHAVFTLSAGKAAA